MRDVTAVAQANSDVRQAAATSACADDPSGRLRPFQDLVAASLCSTNATAAKVVAYNRAGGIVDSRRYHGDQAAFEASQGGALPGREAFEDLWEHGRRFVYGAVNAGGMGAEDFGDVCLVLADVQDTSPDALAVFPEDSVSRYTNAVGDVDGDRASDEVTAWGDRGSLAVCELGGDALGSDDEGWPAVVCARSRYLEVVVAGELPPAALAEVRLRTGFLATSRTLRARVVAGEALPPDEANIAAAYDVLRGWRRALGVDITGIPDD